MKSAETKPIFVMAKRTNGRWHPLGGFALKHLPRIGELIETEVEGLAEMFAVIAIIHPTQRAPCSAEVWAIHAGTSSQVHARLVREHQ